jgi:hypothetical protein
MVIYRPPMNSDDRGISAAQGRLIGRAGVTALALAVGSTIALAQPSETVAVPFVGCAGDGQTGAIEAPAAGATPRLDAATAEQLAYYASEDLAVLAPRGWHCFELYGSDGALLIVTPERHRANDLFDAKAKLLGPAVVLSQSFGGTSGRFAVAKVAARLFPSARAFVQQVIDEGVVAKEEFANEPYPDDMLTRRSDTEVEFVTSANRDGLGTDGRVAKNDQPISGVAILLTDGDNDLIKLETRLPADLYQLTPTIIVSVEASLGAPMPAN